MLTTKLHKLRSMPAAEIKSRIGEVLRRQYERWLWKRGGTGQLFAANSSFDADAMVESCREIVVGSQPHQIQHLKRQLPKLHTNLRRAAREARHSIFSGHRIMLGNPTDLRGRIDWHTDPKTGHVWERKFYADIPFGGTGPDVKYCWEVSRHQYLADLAQSWLLTSDTPAAAHAEAHLLDWIEQNPLYEGVHWTSALEAAMRAISWTWTVAGVAESFANDRLQTIANGLADHATYLQHHLSYFSSPFNHLIGEAAGLYLISFVLRQHPSSDEWRELARKVLEEHGPLQFYDDGFGVEQAMGYHFFTLGFLTLATLIARREEAPLNQLEEVVHRGYLAASALRGPDGRWPILGDLDSARSFPVQHLDYWNFGSLCSLAAVMFDDPELAFDDQPSEELYWLLGVEGVRHCQELANQSEGAKPRSAPFHDQPTLRRHFLADSGYVVATCQNDWLLFDAGPIAGGLFENSTPSTAHGHADTLQVLYSMEGSPVLSDSGILSYGGDRDWIDHFRSPAAHNTLEVSGSPVAKAAGKLAWSNAVAKPRLAARLGEEIWFARGAIDLEAGVSVQRHIMALPGNGVWIADWINTKSPREVTWYWQLGDNDYQVSQEGNMLILQSERGVSINVCASTTISDWEFLKASDHSPIGWKASDYGQGQRGNRLSIRMPCADKLFVATHVGRTSAPHRLESVTVGGQTLSFGPQVHGSPATLDSSLAEAVWTVGGPEGVRSHFAGLSKTDLPGLTELEGVGDWQVFSTPPIEPNTSPIPTNPSHTDAFQNAGKQR